MLSFVTVSSAKSVTAKVISVARSLCDSGAYCKYLHATLTPFNNVGKLKKRQKCIFKTLRNAKT